MKEIVIVFLTALILLSSFVGILMFVPIYPYGAFLITAWTSLIIALFLNPL